MKYQQLERKFFLYFKIATASTIAVYSAYVAVNWYLYLKMSSPTDPQSISEKSYEETKANLALACL
ncbi:MAG: hypothetical protein ACKO96_04745, partial [Flammeovirgaceae bacterium]